MTAFTAARRVANSRAADHQQAEGDVPGAGCCRASARLCVAFRGACASLCALLWPRGCRFAAAAAALPRGGLVSVPPSPYVPCAAYPFPASAAAVACRPPFPAGLFKLLAVGAPR